MDKKTAHYFATLAARETFNQTFTKLAQKVEMDPSGRAVHVETEEKEGTPYDPSKNTGGEVKYERIDDKKVNRPDYGSESLFADDKKDDDKKCPECGCSCMSKKKEAASKSSLMRVAAAYAAKASK